MRFFLTKAADIEENPGSIRITSFPTFLSIWENTLTKIRNEVRMALQGCGVARSVACQCARRGSSRVRRGSSRCGVARSVACQGTRRGSSRVRRGSVDE